MPKFRPWNPDQIFRLDWIIVGREVNRTPTCGNRKRTGTASNVLRRIIDPLFSDFHATNYTCIQLFITMVLLTMTAAMVEALLKIQALETADSGIEQRIPSATAKKQLEDDVAQENASQNGDPASELKPQQAEKIESISTPGEPSLRSPQVGNPISHGQAIALSHKLKAQNITPNTLDGLLRGARVYIAPPPPKPEPVSLVSTNTGLQF